MKWIGLTGGIACGKSQVSKFFIQLGASVVDADAMAHRALEKGSTTYSQIVDHFGDSILAGNGEIDRKALGALIFSAPEQRLFLESVVHPYVQDLVAAERLRLAESGVPWAIYDVPLLFEKGLEANFDKVLVVSCTPEIQLQRLLERPGSDPSQAKARIASQWPLPQKEAAGDYLLWNNGTLEELRVQVADLKNQFDLIKT